MLAQGEKTAQLEREFAAWLEAPSPGIAVASGSAAIVLALRALEVGDGDEVLISSYNCTKVLEAVLSAGATPVLTDIGPGWMLRPEDVRPHLSPKTRAIIVPHFMGIFSDARAFLEFGVPVIEDCAQAIGARGSHRIHGDIAIFSFHPTKLITTGEGGMAIAPRAELAARMRYLRDGDARLTGGRLFSPMSDLASALGLSQLRRYPQALKRRQELARRYLKALRPVVPQAFAHFPESRSMFFRFPLEVDGGTERYQRGFLERGVRVSKGVDALLHRSKGLGDKDFSRSVHLFDRTVSLPIYPALSDAEFDRCVAAAIELLG